MRRWLMCLLGVVGCTAAGATTIEIPSAPGGGTRPAAGAPRAETPLRADYVPAGTTPAAGIVALHGCGGPYPARDTQWRDAFAAAGHPTVWPDSFGSRGLGSQCGTATRTVSAGGARRRDAIAAAQWLAAQPGTPPGGVVLVGWSNGGSTVLAAASGLPPGLVRGMVAFYPGCQTWLDRPGWSPDAPLLIVMGEADDWTPAGPCHALAQRFPDRIELVTYPGAFHDFDVPNRPVRIRSGLAFSANGSGTAHAGTDPTARADALMRVPAFIAGLPPRM